MAKQTRQRGSASTANGKRKQGTARTAATGRAAAGARARPARSAGKPPPAGAAKRPVRQQVKAAPPAPVPPAPAAAPPPPARKPGYYEALSMYETGVRALQRHDYVGAAGQFRLIIERYPEERELQERSQLYLRVCERETARRPPSPQTAQERVYAATVALNAGNTAAALDHLRRAIEETPDSDHAHYIMSVALVASGDQGQALHHLRQAITLNPDNRSLALQDPDLEQVRGAEGFRELLDGAGGSSRSRTRKPR
jgi:tetratricopeptide (TPR) repeat protein